MSTENQISREFTKERRSWYICFNTCVGMTITEVTLIIYDKATKVNLAFFEELQTIAPMWAISLFSAVRGNIHYNRAQELAEKLKKLETP